MAHGGAEKKSWFTKTKEKTNWLLEKAKFAFLGETALVALIAPPLTAALAFATGASWFGAYLTRGKPAHGAAH